MRTRSRGIFVFLLLTSLPLWGADRLAGTWKLNPAKSTFTADHAAPRSLIVTVQEQEGGIVVDVIGEDAKGSPIHGHYSAKFNGMDYPATGLPDGSETISLTQIDANTMESTSKKNGQVMTTVRSVVSPDGRTRTSTFTGKDSKGNPETWVQVYDKQ
ncbi:MAG TPA: hypothetical protein VNV88_08105 [Candidatus Solibacter sp.]|jgi:hypothetical protein|nr:hypothetical protein [Candidatus Solibacter sp.]